MQKGSPLTTFSRCLSLPLQPFSLPQEPEARQEVVWQDERNGRFCGTLVMEVRLKKKKQTEPFLRDKCIQKE